MTKGIFVTGTDTGVGKTLVTGLLARYLSENGVKVVTQKWVETGTRGESADVLSHIALMGRKRSDFADYLEDMAPYVLGFAASPHLAARMENRRIDPAVIESSFSRLGEAFDLVIIEGAGGMMVPLDDETTMADMVGRLGLPAIVVAENKLGAINQCLLTAEAARKRGIEIAALVLNRLSRSGSEQILKDNARIISKMTGVETVWELPFSRDTEELYGCFRPLGEKIAEKLIGPSA